VSGAKLLVSALTDVGRARSTNEDAFAIKDLATGNLIETSGAAHAIDVAERGVLLALSDGMGGHQAGEVASALVLATVNDTLADDTRAPIHEQLEQAVQRANREVLSAAKRDNREGMGATITAVFIRGNDAYIAEVGDSRAYLLRKGRLRQITRDQSLVQLMVESGVMSPEDARTAPGKNVILQAVGLDGDIRVAIARLALRRGDRFLLCSDGVTNAVSDDELRQILTESDPRAACETMIGLANDRGGIDNETAIVADVSGDGVDLPDEFETVTETYEVLQRYDAKLKGGPAAAAAVLAAATAPAKPDAALPALPRREDDEPDVEVLPDLPVAEADHAPGLAPDRAPGPAPDLTPASAASVRRMVIAAAITAAVVLAIVVAVLLAR